MANGLGRLDLATPVQQLKGVGPRRTQALAKAGVRTIEDLLLRLPFRYEDRRQTTAVVAATGAAAVTLRVKVVSVRRRSRRPPARALVEAVVEDASGQLPVVFFNQPYLAESLSPGQEIWLHGRIQPGAKAEIVNPELEPVVDGQAPLNMNRLVPVHERIGPLAPRALRSLVKQALDGLGPVAEVLPAEVVDRLHLMGRGLALGEVQFPTAGDPAELARAASPAHRRLIFEELFLEQFALAMAGETSRRRGESIRLQPSATTGDTLRAILPFPLTAAQRRVFKEIVADLGHGVPMRRLLQGDVGSGKTIVAALAMAMAADLGHQAALMVPTEVLAEQHARTLGRLYAGRGWPVTLLTGSLGRAEQEAGRARVASGEARIVVGTQALIQEGVKFHDLALAVVDEQHRFGVEERLRLGRKGSSPHLLVMTATPIPRSLALAVYGDLNLSVIDEMPPGRLPVRTVVKSAAGEAEVYALARREVGRGRQVYVVCPLVEESEKVDIMAATAWAERLDRELLAGLRIGLVHGRLGAAERTACMEAFGRGELDVLVATTVIEVGLDVTNASLMIVEQAERFGLAQLHQLRGRIGRGRVPSTCVLMVRSPLAALARRRLRVVRDSQDGFAVAQADLELRGPGDLGGTRQWGLPALRVSQILRDHEILEIARSEARALLARPEYRSSAEAEALARLAAQRLGGVAPGEGG